MQTIKTYKTISILVALIIFFAILSIFTKFIFPLVFKSNSSPVASSLSNQTKPTDSFIHPESLNIPSSFMGYTVTKNSSGSAGLGKNVLRYKNTNISLDGFEWVIKKDKVSEIEYSQVKTYIDGLIKSKLIKSGWKDKAEYNGGNLSMNPPNMGYVKVADGKIQIAILKESRSASGNVEIHVFLSKVEGLNKILK